MRSYGRSLLSVFRHLPVCLSQSLIVPSRLPLAKVCPSGLKATDHTPLVCPCSVMMHCPVLTSQILTIWSIPPLAITSPSGLKATDFTGLACPCKILRHCPLLTSQNRMV